MDAYKVQKGLVTQKMNNEVVIFDGGKNVLYSLNKTAAQIFNYIKKGWNSEKIAKKIATIYFVDYKRAKNDIDSLINDLQTKKIITKSKSSSK